MYKQNIPTHNLERWFIYKWDQMGSNGFIFYARTARWAAYWEVDHLDQSSRKAVGYQHAEVMLSVSFFGRPLVCSSVHSLNIINFNRVLYDIVIYCVCMNNYYIYIVPTKNRHKQHFFCSIWCKSSHPWSFSPLVSPCNSCSSSKMTRRKKNISSTGKLIEDQLSFEAIVDHAWVLGLETKEEMPILEISRPTSDGWTYPEISYPNTKYVPQWIILGGFIPCLSKIAGKNCWKVSLYRVISKIQSLRFFWANGWHHKILSKSGHLKFFHEVEVAPITFTTCHAPHILWRVKPTTWNSTNSTQSKAHKIVERKNVDPTDHPKNRRRMKTQFVDSLIPQKYPKIRFAQRENLDSIDHQERRIVVQAVIIGMSKNET